MKSILLLFVSVIATLIPIISFSQQDYPPYPRITQQIPSMITQQIPLGEKQLQPGYLILATIITNDNGGTKLGSDFTINIIGNSFILGSFRALPAPEIKIVSFQEGNYSIAVSNTQGYDVSQKNQCEGEIKSGEVKTCLITIDDEPLPPNGEEKPLTPVSLVASIQDLGKEANKTADSNFETRWSAYGKGQFIEFTFNKSYKITKVALTGYWYHKTYFFEINGKSFENPAGRQPGQLVEYDLKDLNINSNKVRIVGQGNNSTDYNSYREIVFYTTDKVM